MDLTIIIVNWNTRDMLKDCLHSIMQTKGNIEIQIIVVDNASSDGSREMVSSAFPEVTLINSGDNIGFAKANNLAIPHTTAPYILFLNPDTLLINNALKKMVNFLNSNPSVGALGCKTRNIDGTIQDPGLQWRTTPFTKLIEMFFISSDTIKVLKRYLPYHEATNSGYVSWIFGGCLMVREKALERAGNFDERFFMYLEDADLCRRIIDSGWKIYYLSEAEVIHVGGGASNKTTNQFATLMMCESMSKFMFKYYGKQGRIVYKYGVFISSCLRLTILLMFKMVKCCDIISKKTKGKKNIYKYTAMIKWSLGIKLPKIN